jgi:HSP20 family protein
MPSKHIMVLSVSSFTLPENVDATKINAKYNNGILEVSIPKDEKKVLKQTIKVS